MEFFISCDYDYSVVRKLGYLLLLVIAIYSRWAIDIILIMNEKKNGALSVVIGLADIACSSIYW